MRISVRVVIGLIAAVLGAGTAVMVTQLGSGSALADASLGGAQYSVSFSGTVTEAFNFAQGAQSDPIQGNQVDSWPQNDPAVSLWLPEGDAGNLGTSGYQNTATTAVASAVGGTLKETGIYYYNNANPEESYSCSGTAYDLYQDKVDATQTPGNSLEVDSNYTPPGGGASPIYYANRGGPSNAFPCSGGDSPPPAAYLATPVPGSGDRVGIYAQVPSGDVGTASFTLPAIDTSAVTQTEDCAQSGGGYSGCGNPNFGISGNYTFTLICAGTITGPSGGQCAGSQTSSSETSTSPTSTSPTSSSETSTSPSTSTGGNCDGVPGATVVGSYGGAAGVGTSFCNGDTITTGPHQGMTIQWPDGSVTQVGPNSSVDVEPATSPPDEPPLLQQTLGSIWSTVTNALGGADNTQYGSGEGVAGPRGCSMTVTVTHKGANGLYHAIQGEVILTDLKTHRTWTIPAGFSGQIVGTRLVRSTLWPAAAQALVPKADRPPVISAVKVSARTLAFRLSEAATVHVTDAGHHHTLKGRRGINHVTLAAGRYTLVLTAGVVPKGKDHNPLVSAVEKPLKVR